MANRLIDMVNSFGARSYTPITYSENKKAQELKAKGGDLDRLIHETGVKIIFESITDISLIDFYTLSLDEKNRLWSEIANRMRKGNNPFGYLISSGVVTMLGASTFGGPFNPYESIAAESGLDSEKVFNQVIIDCYKRSKDTNGLKDFGKELQDRGYIAQAKEIYEILQTWKSQTPQRLDFDKI